MLRTTVLGSAVLRSTLLSAAVLWTAMLRARAAVLLAAVRLALLRTTVLRTTVLRSALLGTTMLRPDLLRAAVRLALLWVLLRVAVLARLLTLRAWALLGPEVRPLRGTVLWPRTAGTWVGRWLVLVGHKLPRWLRWPHRRTCKG